MGKFTRPSTNLLPMKDIADELELVHGFQKAGHVSRDTSRVAGTDSEKIAISYDQLDPTQNNLSDPRRTVLNAKNLNGMPAAEYMTKEEMANTSHNLHTVQDEYLKEIRLLRDEVYRMQSHFQKTGLLRNTPEYRGFIDPFNPNDVKYENYQASTIIGVYPYGAQDLTVTDPTNLHRGDYITVRRAGHDADMNVVQIVEKTHNNIRVYPALTFSLEEDQGQIFKSLGEYFYNRFVFSRVGYSLPGESTRYSTLRDDREWESKIMDGSGKGFANSFYVDGDPDRQTYLASYGIHARITGVPGNLMCYIIKESDVEKFRTGNQSEDLELFYQSKPLEPNTTQGSNWTKYTFDFSNNEPYPRLNENETYVAVVVAIGDTARHNPNSPDDQGNFNYWTIKAIKGQDDQVHTGYVFYEYTNVDGIPQLLTNDLINRCDLYHVVGLREITHNQTAPLTNGLYTAQIPTPSTLETKKVQVNLQVKREGYAMVNLQNTYGSIPAGEAIRLQEDLLTGMSQLEHFGFSNGETIILGDHIGKITEYDNGTLRIDRDVNLSEDYYPAYKLNYELYIRGYKNVDGDKEYAELPIKLDLKKAIRASFSKSSMSSDRLIFEGDLPEEYDGIALQIRWRNTFANNGAHGDAYHGRIEDLIVTFDRAFDFH